MKGQESGKYCGTTYVCFTVLKKACRPTGWHRESGLATGGHVAVYFLLSNNNHVTTQHVYKMDEAYEGEYSDLYVLLVNVLIHSYTVQKS